MISRSLGPAAFAATLFVAGAAAAANPCQRPTDPGGYNGYTYGTATVSHYDGQSVRVFYTTTGTHAVNPASTQPDMTPDDVVTAAKVGDDALAQYAKMGFLPPIADPGAAPDICGGDARLDIYLMHFNAADGDTATEGCKTVGAATQCWAFALVESRLASIYGSFELGAHVVIAHELFHAVQNAYDSGLDPFWSEGTAQWGAKTLDPAENDLESFLPAFFSQAGKSIDITGGGIVADFLYGSAIWPVFLTQHVGADTVRASLAQEGMLGPPSMKSIDAALMASGTSLADVFPTFVAWNAATGARAGTSGYAEAAKYPEVKLTPFPSSGTVSDIVTGYSSFYYSYDFGAAPEMLALTADSSRVAARAFPLVNGKGALDMLAPLPTTVSGPGVVIIAGISSKKSDAPFTIAAAAAVEMPDGGTMDASSDASDDGGAPDAGDDAAIDAANEDASIDDASAGDASTDDASPPDAATDAQGNSPAASSSPPSGSSGGCGCTVAGAAEPMGLAAFVALAFGLGLARRRRRLA